MCEIAIALRMPKNTLHTLTSQVPSRFVPHTHHNFRPHFATCRGTAATHKSGFENLDKKR